MDYILLAIGAVVTVFVVMCGYGYVNNIIMLVKIFNQASYVKDSNARFTQLAEGLLLLRLAGTVFFPLGVILGFVK